jgi:phosphoadenosine phosphosulfate reductase
VTWDTRNDLVQINPLANWTAARSGILLENNVPYNPLHDQVMPSGYPLPQPTSNSTDERADRWQGYNKVECGLHYPLKK